MADEGSPAGFSSPMGSGSLGAKRGSAAFLATMTLLDQKSKSIADNMGQIARDSERAAHAQTTGGRTVPTASSMLGMGAPVGGATANGGGAAFGGRFGGRPAPLDSSNEAYDLASYDKGRRAPTYTPKPLGGGANIPAAPAGNASAPGSPAGTITNNPSSGGSGGGGGGILKKALLTMGGAVVASAINPATFSGSDFLANRAAMTMTGGYNKQSAGNILSSFSGGFMSQEQKSQMFMPLVQGSGYGVGSQGFGTVAQGAQSIGTLNPMLAAQAGQMSNELRGPQMFNSLRASYGVSTIGPGGKARSFGDIAHDLERQATGSNKPMTTAQVDASSGPTSMFRASMTAAGMSSDMQQSLLDRFQAEAKAGKLLTDKQASQHGAKNQSTDSIYGSMQDRAGHEDKVITTMMGGFAKGFQEGTDKIDAALTGLADVLGAHNDLLGRAIGRPAGWAGSVAHGGGAMSNKMGGAAIAGLGAAALTRGAASAREAATLASAAGASRGMAGMMGAGGAAVTAGKFLAPLAVAEGLNMVQDSVTSHFARGNSTASHLARAGMTVGKYAATGATIGTMLAPGLGTAIGGGLGAVAGGVKAVMDWGDGPGRPSVGSAVWTGTTVGRFNGREFGDGLSDAEKQRGGMTYGVIEKFMHDNYPAGGYKVSSDLRHGQAGITVSGNVSYHATGQAVDFTGPSPSVDSPQLLAINKFWSQYSSGLNELIYAGPGGVLIKDGKPVSAGFYGKDVMDIHHNHVHVAATAGMLKTLKKGRGKGGQSLFGSIVSGIQSAAKSVWNTASSLLGMGKKTTKGRVAGGTQAMLSLASRNAQAGQVSQRGLIEQLLQGSDDMGFGRGMGPGRVDPGEAMSGSSGQNKGSLAKGAGGTSSVSSTGGGGVAPRATGGRYDVHQLAALARSVGFAGSDLINAVSVALAESGGNIRSISPPNADQWGSRDEGLWQINNHWHSEVKNPLDPVANARAAYQISDHGTNFGPWSTWHNGAAASERNLVTTSLSKSEIGDGPGHAMVQTADVPEVRHSPMMGGGRGGGGSLSVHGGSSISIGKVEVYLTAPQVSQAEAKRIGMMVANQIASEARKKAVMR